MQSQVTWHVQNAVQHQMLYVDCMLNLSSSMVGCRLLVHSCYAGTDVLVHCSDMNVFCCSGHGPLAKCSCWPRMTQFMSGVSACFKSLMAQSKTALATLSRQF